MKSLRYFLAILTLNLSIRFGACSEHLFIKWIIDSQIPSNDNALELELIIPNPLRENKESYTCKWYKSDQFIDEAKPETQNYYVYKRTRNACNLLIINHNFESDEQIAFYKPVLNSNLLEDGELSEIVYAVAYLKSFEILRHHHDDNSSSIEKYECIASFILPVSDNKSLNEKVKDALNDNVYFNVNLEKRRDVIKKISNHDLNKRNSDRFISFILKSEIVEVFKTKKDDALFTCELSLNDEKSKQLYFKHFIHEDFNKLDTFDDSNSFTLFQQNFYYISFLLVFSFKFKL